MFRKEADFEAFERVIVEMHERQPLRILSYCVLSNHWHFVVWPEEDGQLTAFFRRLAHTHAMLASITSDGGVWAPVSRTIQEFPGTG